MPDARRVKCQRCKRHVEECGPVSWRGLCDECWKTAVVTNMDGLHYKRGEPLTRWRRAMILSVGGILPDDLDTITEGR